MQKAKPDKTKKKAAAKRSPMKPAPERMRVLAEHLSAELAQWPHVTVKRAFGMMLAYRGKAVFAALPHTKAIYREDAIMLKFNEEKPAMTRRMESDPRFVFNPDDTGRSAKAESRKWRHFVIRDETDVHLAIEWLAEAYELAREPKTRR